VIECIHSTSPAGRSRRKFNISFSLFFFSLDQSEGKDFILFYFIKTRHMHEQSEIAGPSNLAGGRTAREKEKKR
jgi:hypothetical protein